MSNQDCPGVSTVAIAKVGVTSVSGGYGAANTFLDDRIETIPQKTCQRCAFTCTLSTCFFSLYLSIAFMLLSTHPFIYLA